MQQFKYRGYRWDVNETENGVQISQRGGRGLTVNFSKPFVLETAMANIDVAAKKTRLRPTSAKPRVKKPALDREALANLLTARGFNVCGITLYTYEPDGSCVVTIGTDGREEFDKKQQKMVMVPSGYRQVTISPEDAQAVKKTDAAPVAVAG